MLDLNKKAGVLVKTTLVDFPGRVASSFFLKGCNLRCPYCYNTGLVLNNDTNSSLISVNELFEHLEKRRNLITGLTLSGGEALISPYLETIIKKAKSLGLAVKLDTNGVMPKKLEALINNPDLCPDFIAMDIKTSPDRYAKEISADKSDSMKEFFKEQIELSVKLLSSFPKEKREFRTVLVPPLITKEDIKNIAALLPPDSAWMFAQFRNENCLNPSFNEISPYLDSEIKELINFAKSLIIGSELR